MKSSWTTILLIVGLVGLLALLGTLQFRWLTQISRSEGEKAHKRVQEQADHFAMDFNREIQNAYFNFQTEPESWKNQNWAPFNERYDYWREKTNYPALVTDFYFFEVNRSTQPQCYEPGKRAFGNCRDAEAVAKLRARVEGEKPFRAVYEDTFTLVMPIQDISPRIENVMMRRVPDNIARPVMKMPDNFAYLAIKLDPDTIREHIIPDLTAKYFGDGEFNVGVNDRQGQSVIASIDPSSTDASAKLLDLSPDNFIFFANKDLMSTIDDKHEGFVINSRVETGSFKRSESADDNNKTLKIEVQNGPRPRTQIFTSTSGPTQQSPWTLVVQHVSGSLDASIAATLRRNLAVGFGILLLLAAAIAAIIISAQRAKTVARRQIDFVSSVSHEFRTPLAVIYSASENLADGVAKENTQVASYGNLIKAEGKKLSGMVEQILDFAGANSGRRKYSFTDTAVSAK